MSESQVQEPKPAERVTFFSRHKEATIEYTKTTRGPWGEVLVPGKWLEFERGQLTTDNPAAIAYIRGMPEFGVTIYERSAADGPATAPVAPPIDNKEPAVKEERKVGRK